jgi:type IV secretion system protein VirB6
MFLMLGTVGILVTARIALAVLLAVGPVFVTFILFNGTRGLFAGWLRGVILTAITPLFAVLGGGLMIELATPIVVALRASEVLDPRAAMALLIFSIVHCALMALAIRVASAMVSGWQVFGMANASSGEPGGAQRVDQSALAANSPYGASTASALSRSQSLTASVIAANAVGGSGAAASSTTATTRNIVNTITGTGSAIGSGAPARSRGIGSRFASRPPVSRELLR